MPADISSFSRSKHMLLGPPNLSKKFFGWCIKPAPEHTREIHMRRTCQLPVGALVLPWGVAALVLCALVVPAQIVHAQRAICTLCELRPGNCSPETLAACRGDKGTGETGGSDVPRDSKTKAPRDECQNAAAELQKLYQRYNELETRLKKLGEMYMQENTMISPEGASIMEAMAGIRGQIANLRAKCNLGGVPPGKTPGEPPSLPPPPTGGGSGGGGSGGGGDGGPGGGFGGGKGGRQAFLVPTRDIQGPRQDDGGKGSLKWPPWKRGNRESSQPGPAALGPGSLREDIAPLPKERLPEILAALDQFGAASQGKANLPALNSILENARRESDSNLQAEILKTVLPLLLAALRDPAYRCAGVPPMPWARWGKGPRQRSRHWWKNCKIRMRLCEKPQPVR